MLGGHLLKAASQIASTYRSSGMMLDGRFFVMTIPWKSQKSALSRPTVKSRFPGIVSDGGWVFSWVIIANYLNL